MKYIFNMKLKSVHTHFVTLATVLRVAFVDNYLNRKLFVQEIEEKYWI